MEDKKNIFLKCWLRTFAAYALISFLWIAFIAMGTNDNSNATISVFADKLVYSNIAIMVYSFVYGFSLLLMKLNVSSPAKYTLHMLVNYIASMICVYALFANLKDDPAVTTTTWMAVILVATVVFLVIYGIACLIINWVKKKFA